MSTSTTEQLADTLARAAARAIDGTPDDLDDLRDALAAYQAKRDQQNPVRAAYVDVSQASAVERIGGKRTLLVENDVRDTMVREYATWLKAQGLQLGCAQEALMSDDSLSDPQVTWLADYVRRWEAMERAENHGRIGLSPAGDSFEDSLERVLTITDGALIDWRETDEQQHDNDRSDDLAVREIEWLYWRPRLGAAMRLLQDVPTATLVAAQTPEDLLEALQQAQGMKAADAAGVATGPWLVEPGTGTISAPPLEGRRHREPVAYCPFYIRNAEENAKRIVASVNLLSDMPVDALEQLKGPDELIEALQQGQGMKP